MTQPHYTPARYIVQFTANPATGKGSACCIVDTWGVYPPMKSGGLNAHRIAADWNTGRLHRHEAAAIARHFMIAAAWADAPEGTRPRPTAKALEAARTLAHEFAQGLGVPLFRACLEAYAAEGLHPDCNGDACAAFGHDLYLTLAGHGTGFWDRDALGHTEGNTEALARLGMTDGQTIGERITEHCHSSRWRDLGGLEFCRGWIHFREPLKP